jgi:hypothetical protein
MRVNNNKVATRSTKGMKDGVGERAKKANPAESMGKTTVGCLVKAISLKVSTGICAAEVLSTEELIASVECTLWALMGSVVCGAQLRSVALAAAVPLSHVRDSDFGAGCYQTLGLTSREPLLESAAEDRQY